jgi:hypothetical protein
MTQDPSLQQAQQEKSRRVREGVNELYKQQLISCVDGGADPVKVYSIVEIHMATKKFLIEEQSLVARVDHAIAALRNLADELEVSYEASVQAHEEHQDQGGSGE